MERVISDLLNAFMCASLRVCDVQNVILFRLQKCGKTHVLSATYENVMYLISGTKCYGAM